MAKKNLEIGSVYNRLTVIDIAEPHAKRGSRVVCKCICGAIKTWESSRVKRGEVKSCGCLFKEVNIGNKYNARHTYNTNFFKSLTNDSLYVLGLLYSDGCLQSDSNTFYVGLKKDDKDLLEQISRLLKNTDKLSDNEHTFRVVIHHKEMYNDLLSLGLYSNKSLTLTIPDYLKNEQHFWRGMIDGDGSLGIYKNKFRITLCGTQLVCESFKDYCKSVGVESKAKIVRNKDTVYTYTVTCNQAKKLAAELYKDKNLFLDRKYKIYEKSIS